MREAVKAVLLPVVRPIWRRVWHRIEARVAPLEACTSSLDARISSLEGRAAPLDMRMDQMEGAWRTHIPSFLNAVATVPAVSHEVASLSRRLDVAADAIPQRVAGEVAALSERLDGAIATLSQRSDFAETRGTNADASIVSLWERIEFVRRELLFEFSHGSGGRMAPDGSGPPTTTARIIAADKLAAARAEGRMRLNLGSGHIALPDYINVDIRELPGVDVVADVGDLPFEAQSVDEIFSAHLIEHFPLEAVRRRLLPYWRSRLRPGGTFRAVTPDAAAMLSATAAGSMPFDDFREVVYGAQDYAGDYHFNLFTPESLHTLLQQAGFQEVAIAASARRNGKCFEFEIEAIAP